MTLYALSTNGGSDTEIGSGFFYGMMKLPTGLQIPNVNGFQATAMPVALAMVGQVRQFYP